MDHDIIVHEGGCHCRKVRWRVQAPNSVVAWKCNCSDCSMRGNVHLVFLLRAKHIFCKVCGITSFYIRRGSPDKVAITFRCVDPGSLSHGEMKPYDGKNWERAHDQTDLDSCSITADPK
ncbi:hypothetical protein Patl1_21180 [Pistacia atlantica]|uniref:Uncharacterized protein n=1 Tax=Pistacia atlantica TaxID=434234 RepID=A0ACC1BLP6_9ROSI|nr:hypothetical protein Patl1_21180 [Pistacia atlantica]